MTCNIEGNTSIVMTSPRTENGSTEFFDIPDKCVIILKTTQSASDDVSEEFESLVDAIQSAIFGPILFLIGVPANLLNLAVFFSQGLRKRINLCLFSLALVDLAYLGAIVLHCSERMYTVFTTGERSGPFTRYLLDTNITGIYGFGYASMFLSTIISSERCFCVLFPLRSQAVLRTKTMSFIIVFGVVAIVLMRFVVTGQYQMKCVYEISTNRTTFQVGLSEYYFKNKDLIKGLDAIFFGFCLTVACPMVVLMTTSITAIKLKQTIAWRVATSSSENCREIALTKMLICHSIEFLLLSSPYLLIRIVPLFVPQFSTGGRYQNMFWTIMSIGEICSQMSSTANFFVYYVTGTKYRKSLQNILGTKDQVRKPNHMKSNVSANLFVSNSD